MASAHNTFRVSNKCRHACGHEGIKFVVDGNDLTEIEQMPRLYKTLLPCVNPVILASARKSSAFKSGQYNRQISGVSKAACIDFVTLC